MESKQFTTLIAMTFFDGNSKWIGLSITILFPYFLSLMKNIWVKMENWYYPKGSTIYIQQNNKKDGDPIVNMTYKSMCWYITEKYNFQQKSFTCEEDSYKRTEKIGSSYIRIPDYIPNSKFTFLYNKNDIMISFYDNGNSKIIRLYGDDMSVLTNFVDHVNLLYTNHFYNNLNPDMIYTCDVKNPKHTNDDVSFNATEMRINKTWDNIYLPDRLMNDLKSDINEFKLNESFYMKMGIPYKRGYLFYGPPGTGKSSTAYAIARENKMNLYRLDFNTLVKPNQGRKVSLREVVNKIPQNSVVLVEEVDMQIFNDRKPKILDDKDNKNKIDTDSLPMSHLMDVLDGYDSLHGCIIILTTNHKEHLDDALIRPGRVDIHYHFGPLNSSEIKRTIKSFAGYDIDIPDDIEMTSSFLLNHILLPNLRNLSSIKKYLLSYEKNI